ncbi:hypothetical protein HK097_000482, partial [Rhizophlyctis rosea]
MKQLVRAMDFVHSYGIFHGDLKAENILLDGHGNLKICDFGCAGHIDRDDQWRGDRRFASPELGLLDEEHDHLKVDVWGVGIIM